MAKITATYAVVAGTCTDFDLDVTGLDAQEIAALVEDMPDGVSVCHECSEEIQDPQVEELTSFTVDGVHYGLVNGFWAVVP